MENLILYLIVVAAGGVGVGYVSRIVLAGKRTQNLEQKQKELLLAAKDEALKIKEEAKKEEEERKKYLQVLEEKLRQRSEALDHRSQSLDYEREKLIKGDAEINKIKKEISEIKDNQAEKLGKIAKLSREEAKEFLLKDIEREYKDELVRKIKIEREALRENVDREAKKIIANVIQRLASEHTAESTATSVDLPNDEMKGRIIGREGRNIQIFEKMTGVDLLIDDTPDTVTISAFDPVRRYVAKVVLERLIQDGRIHPTRIEEMVQKANEDLKKEIAEAGEQAAYEIGIAGLNPDLLKILGRLKFRTSYGQNVLKHSIETAHIARMMAEELGADVNIVKKAGLLHDIGKAVDHDIGGSHLQISCDILKKYGMSEEIIHAVEAHHEDVEAKTMEAIIVKAADAISGSRPGARRETLESYVKRLEELENLANTFEGVEKSYAIQAGREVRIIVSPENINDLEALKLSKDIAKKIEEELQYPGTVKVNVIRETRAISYAK